MQKTGGMGMYGYLFIENFNPEFFLQFQGEKSYIAYPLIN